MSIGDDTIYIDIEDSNSDVSTKTVTTTVSEGAKVEKSAKGVIAQSEYTVTIEYDSKDFDCPVCLEILTDPVTIACNTRRMSNNSAKCECVVCQKCAQKLWRMSNTRNPKCMNCSKAWHGDYEANVFLTNIVNQIERPCVNKPKGCAFMGTKVTLDKHWCPYHETQCPNSHLGCTDTLLRKDILTHALECRHFPCQSRYGGAGCKKLGSCKYIKMHHAVCEHANSKVLRDTIHNLHVQGKICKKGKGFAFGHCNEKHWLQRLKYSSQRGLKFEDFYSHDFISDAYKSLQVMSTPGRSMS